MLQNVDNKTKWDSFYASATREPFLHLNEERIDGVLKAFPSANSALDIGCGEGQLLEQLGKRGLDAVGIDVSPVALVEAKKRIRGVLIEGDFESFVFHDNPTFDLIFLKFVIAFIHDKKRLFEKIDSMLNEGGGLVLLTPIISNAGDAKDIDEVFVKQEVLDEFLPKYFKQSKEQILYAESNKRLSLYICRK